MHTPLLFEYASSFLPPRSAGTAGRSCRGWWQPSTRQCECTAPRRPRAGRGASPLAAASPPGCAGADRSAGRTGRPSSPSQFSVVLGSTAATGPAPLAPACETAAGSCSPSTRARENPRNGRARAAPPYSTASRFPRASHAAAHSAGAPAQGRTRQLGVRTSADACQLAAPGSTPSSAAVAGKELGAEYRLAKEGSSIAAEGLRPVRPAPGGAAARSRRERAAVSKGVRCGRVPPGAIKLRCVPPEVSANAYQAVCGTKYAYDASFNMLALHGLTGANRPAFVQLGHWREPLTPPRRADSQAGARGAAC